MKKTCVATASYLFVALLDGLLTFLNTPDLSMEGNPLVSVLGLGWGALLIANAIGLALFFAIAYFAYAGAPVHTYVEVSNRREYLSQIAFDRPDKFAWTFYKFPKTRRSWKLLLEPMLRALVFAMIFSRLVLVLEWTAVTFDVYPNAYIRFRNAMPFDRVDIWVMLLIFFVLYFVFLDRDFRRNQAMRPTVQ